MASVPVLKTHSSNPSELQFLLQKTHTEALQKNDLATRHWIKLRDEHISLHSHLKVLPDKLSQDVMVPIGSKALMRGKMVHTNEILVCLGDGWFVKRSAKQASEICDRRIKLCDVMLKDLERERDLLSSRQELPLQYDAFGAESRDEIIEPFEEDKEADWKEQHRKKEKEYREQLKELRNKEKQTISDEESLWKRLDELELQEELQEELDRLHAEREDMNYEDEDDDEDSDEESEMMDSDLVQHLLSQENFGGGNGLIRRDAAVNESTSLPSTSHSENTSDPQISSSLNHKPSGRRVSFADEKSPVVEAKDSDSDSDSDSSAETIRIEFKHTQNNDAIHEDRKADDQEQFLTPADINKHVQQLKKTTNDAPKSILKNKVVDLGGSGDMETYRMKWLEQPDSVPIMTQEAEEPLSNLVTELVEEEEAQERPVVFGDVMEHSLDEALHQPEPTLKARPTSRFKAARLASKR